MAVDLTKLVVMGLDLSAANTSICVMRAGPNGRRLPPGFWRAGYSVTRKDPIRRRWQRLANIADLVGEVAEREGVRRVAAEDYAWSATGAQNDLGEVHGAVGRELHRLDLVMMRINIGTARAALDLPTRGAVFMGKKKTVKERIRERLRERGLEFGSDDDVDAYVIASNLWLRVRG